MEEVKMSMEEWNAYLGIMENPEDEKLVSDDDMEGEWEDVRKL